MKRTLLFLLIVISSVVTSCEIVGVDADAMPVTLEIFVKDTEGNNLLDYGWLDGKNVTATFKGETYELQKDVPTRAYMPHFYGFKVTARDLGSMLYFGELDGTHDMNDEFIINWGDGTFDTIVIYNDCRTTMNGGYDIKRHYVVNGVKTENHRITITKETSAPSEPKFPTLEIKGASLNTHTAVVIYDDSIECAVSPVDDKLIVHIVSSVKFSEIQHRSKLAASHLESVEMRHIRSCRHILLQFVCITLECGCDVLPVKPTIIEKIVPLGILHEYLQGDRHSIRIHLHVLAGSYY